MVVLLFYSLNSNMNPFFRLVGDVLLATGFLSYSGPFNQAFRIRLRSNWQSELKRRRIPFTDDLNITAMLVDNATVIYTFFISYSISFLTVILEIRGHEIFVWFLSSAVSVAFLHPFLDARSNVCSITYLREKSKHFAGNFARKLV